MHATNSDLILPSARSRVRVPFVALAAAVSAFTSDSSRLSFIRLSLALALYRDPTPQEIWNRFRELHPTIARAAQLRVASRISLLRNRARYNPYHLDVPATVDLPSADLSLLDIVPPDELDPALAPSIHYAVRSANEALRRRKPPARR
jgi:hypothetical protein